ncbi:MAG: hypothetical protein COB53_11735 [Elusimicrobia bacterium]|nr:MAG: hypothetical protein COB53_11735 [Elusimicrobiota bacterium]
MLLNLLISCLVTSPLAAEEWRLLHEELFKEDPGITAAPWVEDTHGPDSPWEAGHMDEDGSFFRGDREEQFLEHLRSFKIYRKRVAFGDKGWLTAELASRGKIDQPTAVLVSSGIRLSIPRHDGGLILRSTKPLPKRYRVEVKLREIDFGEIFSEEPKTVHPWTWGPSPVYDKPYEQWDTSKETNGFYYLAIVDYHNPAPHNNVFIHTRRKVFMDSYNSVIPSGLVCDPNDGSYFPSNYNALNMLFSLPGFKLEHSLSCHTVCGVTVWDRKPGQRVAAADLMTPELPYSFAIERDDETYTLEASGEFIGGGKRKYRSSRRLEYWKGPDYFILGDPHINYYEGTAIIESIRFFVPSS